MSEWKPGDVARLVYSVGVTTINCRAIRGERCWFTSRGDAISDREVAQARGLVVIDGENREQIERLILALPDAIDWGFASDDPSNPGSPKVVGGIVEPFQAALREFANPTPPRPEEPAGLGAVVEDENGVLWTRVESGVAETRNPWYPAAFPDLQPDEYDHIAVVKVLSEGWSE